MPTKLRIKVGHIEFEYEGDAAFDNGAIKDLFSHIESMMGSIPPGALDAMTLSNGGAAAEGDAETPAEVANLDTQTVAARLGAKTGADVAIAAAAHLLLCEGKKGFSRKELLADMQQAHGYYNHAMSGNLTRILRGLIGQKKIVGTAGGHMTLSAAETAQCRTKLAQY